MVGLPDESFEDIKRTVENIINLNPHYIRIYPLVVLKETPLQRQYEERLFVPIPFEEAIQRTLFIYLNALQHGIKVVKIGLTDNEIIKDRILSISKSKD
jgi:histone acetyltransferase (RNA polymerase elongator complex component)